MWGSTGNGGRDYPGGYSKARKDSTTQAARSDPIGPDLTWAGCPASGPVFRARCGLPWTQTHAYELPFLALHVPR